MILSFEIKVVFFWSEFEKKSAEKCHLGEVVKMAEQKQLKDKKCLG